MRSSWLTLARNSLLSRLDSYSATLLSASWPSFRSRLLLIARKLVGAVLEVGQHRVERLGELLELVAGVDVGADVQVALR